MANEGESAVETTSKFHEENKRQKTLSICIIIPARAQNGYLKCAWVYPLKPLTNDAPLGFYIERKRIWNDPRYIRYAV
jgi:hypothetical protein